MPKPPHRQASGPPRLCGGVQAAGPRGSASACGQAAPTPGERLHAGCPRERVLDPARSRQWRPQPGLAPAGPSTAVQGPSRRHLCRLPLYSTHQAGKPTGTQGTERGPRGQGSSKPNLVGPHKARFLRRSIGRLGGAPDGNFFCS